MLSTLWKTWRILPLLLLLLDLSLLEEEEEIKVLISKEEDDEVMVSKMKGSVITAKHKDIRKTSVG